MRKFMILFSLIAITLLISQIGIGVGESSSNIEVTFETDPTIVISGELGYITLILKNVGSTAIEEIDVSVTSSDWKIIPENDWDIDVGGISPGNSISFLFAFKVSSSASPGLCEVEFEVRTLNAGYVSRSAIIIIEEPSVLDITTVEPDYLLIGQKTTVSFEITNNGLSNINNILFYWEDTNNYILPVGSDNKITISSISSGDTTQLPIDVFASPLLSPGIYPLFITMEYYDNLGIKQIITSEVGIAIGGTTDFEVILQESISGSTTLAIANTGANVASSVIVTIPQQMPYITSGASSVNLGNLDAGDYTLATYEVSSVEINNTQRPDKSTIELPSDSGRSDGFRNQSFSGLQSNNLIVEVSYTDLFGVRQTVEKEIDFSSSSSNSGTSRPSDSKFGGSPPGQSSELDNGTMYIIIGVVGIIVIVTILRIDKVKTVLKIGKGKKK
jgi:hypothetical protein